jgi:hypothetical protein
MNDEKPPKPTRGHASMPRFVTWIQDTLLLPLLMIASGYINGLMLTEGWVPNIEDPHTWGIFHGIGLGILFAAGGAMGGLTVRVGYKLSECILQRQGGRAVFLAFGLAMLSLIEFWASFSQRAPNLHPTAADSLLPWPPFAFSATAILIAAVLPFTSMFWGFTADDPAPKPVESAATVEARMQNQLLEAQYKAQIRAAQAQGIRAGIQGALGRPVGANTPPAESEIPEEVTVFAQENTGDLPDNDGRITAEPPAISGLAERGNWWDPQSYLDYVAFQYGIAIPLKKAIEVIDIVGRKKRIQYVGKPGKPSAFARISALKKYAIAEYGEGKSAAMSGVFAEQMAE